MIVKQDPARLAALSALTAALAACATSPEVESSPDPAALTAAQRADILGALMDKLDASYVFPDKAAEVRTALDSARDAGAYQEVTNRAAFAERLTDDVRAVTSDKHVRVLDGPPPPRRERPTRVFGATRLIDEVAYLEIMTFGVPAGQARTEAREVMTGVADAGVLVVDLREDGGGFPDTVALVCSYLFGDAPVQLSSTYWRVGDRTTDFSTDPSVDGRKFGPTKPVYVLTSPRTFSAAEQFAYDLQALHRAIVVGERTGGGANPGRFEPLPHGFHAFVPSGRSINPITKTSWEGVGVSPHLVVPAEQAFDAAVEHARNHHDPP